jgi:hypothetical protein
VKRALIFPFLGYQERGDEGNRNDFLPNKKTHCGLHPYAKNEE